YTPGASPLVCHTAVPDASLKWATRCWSTAYTSALMWSTVVPGLVARMLKSPPAAAGITTTTWSTTPATEVAAGVEVRVEVGVDVAVDVGEAVGVPVDAGVGVEGVPVKSTRLSVKVTKESPFTPAVGPLKLMEATLFFSMAPLASSM